jgi:hypothetical protein
LLPQDGGSLGFGRSGHGPLAAYRDRIFHLGIGKGLFGGSQLGPGLLCGFPGPAGGLLGGFHFAAQAAGGLFGRPGFLAGQPEKQLGRAQRLGGRGNCRLRWMGLHITSQATDGDPGHHHHGSAAWPERAWRISATVSFRDG